MPRGSPSLFLLLSAILAATAFSPNIMPRGMRAIATSFLLLSATLAATAFSANILPPGGMKSSVYIAITLDGHIADPDGSVGFLDEYQSSGSEEDGDMGFGKYLEEVDLLVMGRKTWDTVMSFGEEMWPYGNRRVWIYSRQTPSSVSIPERHSKQATVVSGSPPDILKRAAEAGHCHAYIDGGSTIREFLKHRCVDELILTRVPLLLGAGIPLFSSGDAEQARKMEHLKTKVYSNGLVQSHYRVVEESA